MPSANVPFDTAPLTVAEIDLSGEKPEPVAICRLKRVAADYKGDVSHRMPPAAAAKNGKRIAMIGAGPASLAVARDLAPLGYHCVVYDQDPKGGGMMRTQYECLLRYNQADKKFALLSIKTFD
mgnify:CR=1 FL=1